ncbi:DUF6519 domain-containing protein [Massilia aurea]|uniref:DUF6519 domain-containing protein n=1 Tax=Massilia aurea TaxID=373040 RepID=UPI003461CA55
MRRAVMKGDFSRDSFNRLRHYTRVLQQQGRVELDSDGNERQAIQLHYLRSLAMHVIGPRGGPGDSFKLNGTPVARPLKGDFLIGKGAYYVDGWLCENDADVYFAGLDGRTRQPWWRPGAEMLKPNLRYLVYLDAWERHVGSAEVDDDDALASPSALREVALGGPDTATRAQVVWQVKVAPEDPDHTFPVQIDKPSWATWMTEHWDVWQEAWQPSGRGQLKARAASPPAASQPCIVSPESRYRGLENQLYRIEIHRGGLANDAQTPTFVWSRENGSVIFPIEPGSNGSASLVEGWRDARFDLAINDVVELSDETTALSGRAGPLLRVTGVDPDSWAISFEGSVADIEGPHPILRRWDHGRRRSTAAALGKHVDGRPKTADDRALLVEEGRWLAIEDGIEIWFEPADAAGAPQHYRSGDYWLVPARTATGNILWPRGPGQGQLPLAQPPHGVEHHYAPLGVATIDVNGLVNLSDEPRLTFKSLVELSNP